MNRREAISAVGILLGGSVVGSAAFLEGCTAGGKKAAGIPFDSDTLNLLNEIADTILPTTPTSGGAKAANVASFMNTMVRDCYEESNQKIFLDGISTIQEECKKKFNTGFMECTPEQRTELLITLDNEQKVYMKSKKKEDPSHYFRMMKELSILGYFNSEIGATQALRYVAVPGRFEGCIPYTKGEKAWATS